MHELTQFHTGRKENDPATWPSEDQIATLARSSPFSFDAFYAVRRYFSLNQLEIISRGACSLNADLTAIVKSMISLRDS